MITLNELPIEVSATGVSPRMAEWSVTCAGLAWAAAAPYRASVSWSRFATELSRFGLALSCAELTLEASYS